MLARALLALTLVAAACGDDPPNVGATCTSSGGCDDGLTCDTTALGGYCTKACTTPGDTAQCPEGAVCDGVAGAAVTCVKICQTPSDCRADQACNGTSGSNLKACKPKP